MEGRLVGKTALVTGASRGIGLAIAEAFAREGCRLALNARGAERLDTVAQSLSAKGTEVRTFAADVCDREAVDKMVQEIENWAPIDILVNNAGIHVPSRFVDYTFDDFKHVIESNVYSVFHVTQSVLPAMIARERGRVINLASTAGKMGSRNQSAYNASKHAVVGITRCLGLELAPHNVLVNAICPWVVNTDMATSFMDRHSKIVGLTPDELKDRMNATVPLQRWIEPEEVAGLAVYFASDESSCINGQAWAVDGGYSMY